jgi:hypothetical protein
MLRPVTSDATFDQVCAALEPGPSGIGEDEYLHGALTEGGQLLYARKPLTRGDKGDEELLRRAKKDGVEVVRQTMLRQYGPDVAGDAFRKVTDEVRQKTGRVLAEGVTRGDLKLLHQEVAYPQKTYQELFNAITTPDPDDRSPRAMLQRFEELKAMVDDDRRAEFRISVTPKDDGGRWTFGFRIGGTEIYHSAPLQDGPGQYWSEFALRRALQDSRPSADTVLDVGNELSRYPATRERR